MSKRFGWALASAMLMGSIGSAHAADMAVKAPPIAPVAAISWTGIYVGGNVGGGWADTYWGSNYNAICSPGFLLPTCDVSERTNSFLGGGQVGARWQTGRFVIGVEGSADFARFHANSGNPFDPPTSVLTRDTKLTGIYTVTGQAGFAWERSLFYAKAGWAGSSLEQTINLNSLAGFGTRFAGTGSRMANGWTAGTGWEYRVASMPNLSFGVEYDYIHLSAGDTTGCYTGGAGANGFDCVPPVPTPPGFVSSPLRFSNFHADINQVLFRANYTFNWAGPVVAKY